MKFQELRDPRSVAKEITNVGQLGNRWNVEDRELSAVKFDSQDRVPLPEGADSGGLAKL